MYFHDIDTIVITVRSMMVYGNPLLNPQGPSVVFSSRGKSLDNDNSAHVNMLRLYMPSVIYTKGTRLSKQLLLLLHPKLLHRSNINRFKIQNTVDSNEGDLSPPTLQAIYFFWTEIWNQVNLAWICSILICKTRHGPLLDDTHQQQYYLLLSI